MLGNSKARCFPGKPDILAPHAYPLRKQHYHLSFTSHTGSRNPFTQTQSAVRGMGKNGLPSCGHDPAFVLRLPRLNNGQARGCPSPSPKGSPPALRSNGQLLSRKSLRQVNTIDSYRLQVTYKRRESSRPQIFPKFLPGRFAFSL